MKVTSALLLLPVVLSAYASTVNGAVYNYAGTGLWSDPTVGWSHSAIPTIADQLWMNTGHATITIPSDYTAVVDKLVVGRHAVDTTVIIDGGLLEVGNDDGDVLFVGQYEDAAGTVNLKSGRVQVSGELAVSVSGGGTWVQTGGTVVVRNRFVIGRYNKVEAVGSVTLRGGSIVANRFDMNQHSLLSLEGGILVLEGNHVSKIQGHVNAGRIVGSPAPKIIYDADAEGAGRTYVYSKTTQLYTNYYGQKESAGARKNLRQRTLEETVEAKAIPSWFDPTAWQPNGLPGPGSEVWMNHPNSDALIGPDEVATANKLVVGRHALDVEVVIDGGTLLVGDEDSASAILFVGQYGDASATITLKSGRIRVAGEFAVGVSGPGAFHQLGGRVDVAKALKVGRYNSPEAIGYLLLNGGEIFADNLNINDHSTVDLRNDGFLSLDGDLTSKIQGYVDASKITSRGTNAVAVTYDAVTSRTLVRGTWDVRGILNFSAERVGPRMPHISRDIMRIREFSPAPEVGVHPRIFFGPDEIPRVRASLENTVVGQTALGAARQITALLNYGRNPCGGKCYNDIPNEEKILPDGRQKVSNAGLFHTNPTYEDLVAGGCNVVESKDGTHWNVLGGGMAIEALDLLIFPEREDADLRKDRLATAMHTWAGCALSNPSFVADGAHGSQASRDFFGGQHMAFAYDLAHGFMTDEQRGRVRKAIATMIWLPEQFTGITGEPYATTSNWVTINSFVPMMILAIEGETTVEDNGWSAEDLTTYFDDIMAATYKFLTYGYYPEGSGYEGSGKNYQYNAMFVAYAKRGYNFFTHPNVQAYGRKFLPSLLQPYGHFITSYDTIGGTGLDAEWGGMKYHANDIIGLKWAYPDDPSVDFIYRQYVETPYRTVDGSKAAFVDVFEQKITPRSTYANAFLSLLIMPSDYDSDGDFESKAAEAHVDLTYYGKERGLVIARSDFSEDALALNFHVRQDMGGHTYGDRNSFTLSGLGRVWIRNPVGYVPETEWSSAILVNGEGITIAPQDGRKARMPGRIASHQDSALATFTTGDATYAYNVAWKWCTCRHVGSNTGIGGWDPVMESWNDFRAPTNQISEFYGDVPFVDYAHWRYGGFTEGIHKQVVNDLSQAYRQAGMIRGEYPYSLIVDDLYKTTDSATTEWQWLAQIPEDLVMVPSSDFSGISDNLDAARDIVFKEPVAMGNRKLLVRILNAEGSMPQGLAEFEEKSGNLSGGLTAWRLIIRRVADRPRFRVMLYPFEDGNRPVPGYSQDGSGAITLSFDGNTADTIKFHPSTQMVGGDDVEITGIEITRLDGTHIIDTRNQAVPMSIRN